MNEDVKRSLPRTAGKLRGIAGARLLAPARLLGVLAAVVLLASDCSSPGSTGSAPPSTASSGGPSVSALMVCSTEAQADIQEAIGVGLSTPPASTFTDGLFTCDYAYPSGTMVLTVKDLTSQAPTDAYVKDARAGLKSVKDLPGLGQAAFSDNVSTVYVVKDFKVLKVDTSGLPNPFGQPPHSRYTVAVAVAAAIILCWTGA
jgi:hypothetical protein